MLFVLEVLRITPALLFAGSIVDIITPNGKKPLKLEVGEEVKIRLQDFNSPLDFVYNRLDKSSYVLTDLLDSPQVTFRFTKLRIDLSIYRILEKKDKDFRPIGHRGSGSNTYRKTHNYSHIQENSLIAFQKAYEMGVHWVEMDLLMTEDEQIVISHDYKVNGTPVWEMSWSHFQSTAESPTLFEELFTKLDPNINLAVEVKYPSQDEIESENLRGAPPIERFTEKIVKIIKKWKNREVFISSFEPEVLTRVKGRAPSLGVYLLTEGVPRKFADPRRNSFEEGVQFCTEHGLQGIVTDAETVVNDPIGYSAAAHSAGLELFLYLWRSYMKTTDHVDEMVRLYCAGADGLVVDDIQMFMSVIPNLNICVYNSSTNIISAR